MKLNILNSATEEEIAIITVSLASLSTQVIEKEESETISFWKKSSIKSKYDKDKWDNKDLWRSSGLDY
ncbi:MAG: hypothetical protein ACK4IX_10860 [Candidatus Sericytochromatia bacterium]